METANTSYYEQATLWDRDFDRIPAEKERLADTMAAIPPDVTSILDVGCGNGYFVNALLAAHPGRFDRVVGLDRSETALRHVRAEAVRGSITELPFANDSFDLVTCLEVLEHLSCDDYVQALSELNRVSTRYLLITVPNAQNLRSELVVCPRCCCCFNRHLHVRSFDEVCLARLFKSFEMVDCRALGPLKTGLAYGPLLGTIRLYTQQAPPCEAVCPQCGHQTNLIKDKRSVPGRGYSQEVLRSAMSRLASVAKVFVPKRKKRPWLLALYKRLEAGRAE